MGISKQGKNHKVAKRAQRARQNSRNRQRRGPLRLFYRKVRGCQHPPLPEPPTTDQRALGPVSRPLLPLRTRSYGPTDLLNMTCREFCEGRLKAHQIAARNMFVHAYLAAGHRADTWAKYTCQALQPKSAYHGAVVSDMAFLEAILLFMMRQLDDFFFFGAMTRVHDGHRAPLLRLQTSYGALRGIAGSELGTTSDSTTPDGKVCVIVNVYSIVTEEAPNRICAVPWSEVISTLMHEMVHAYLSLFTCRGDQCNRNYLNTIGDTGHGPTFLKLQALMLREVRTWSPLLRDMDQSWSLPGGTVDRAALRHEDSAYQEGLVTGSFVGCILPRADSPRNLVRLVIHVADGAVTAAEVIYRSSRARISVPIQINRDKDIGCADGIDDLTEAIERL